MRFHRSDHPAHSRQALSDGALLRLVFQQDARPAQEACRGGTGGGAHKSAATAEQGCGAKGNAAVEIIEHRALKPRRIPSQKWRDLIKKVWEVDPLLCPQCHHEMRIVSLINDAQIIERGQLVIEPWLDDPMPDDDCGL